MNLEKIRARLQKALAGDTDKLYQLARDLGDELPRKRLEILDKFRRILAKEIQEDLFGRECLPANHYLRGYLTALCDVVVAYSAAVWPGIEEEQKVADLRENGFRPIMLALLDLKEPAGMVVLVASARAISMSSTPDEKGGVVKYCGWDEVTNKLAILRERKLVKSFGEPPCYCLTPDGERLAERLKS